LAKDDRSERRPKRSWKEWLNEPISGKKAPETSQPESATSVRGAPPDSSVTLEEEFYKPEELVDRTVYDARARRIGSVKGVAYSKKGRLALVVANEQKQELVLPFDLIQEIGDIILLKLTADEVVVATTSRHSEEYDETRTRDEFEETRQF
jgi:sporulation protein YlmC with PRC-barrel domain